MHMNVWDIRSGLRDVPRGVAVTIKGRASAIAGHVRETKVHYLPPRKGAEGEGRGCSRCIVPVPSAEPRRNRDPLTDVDIHKISRAGLNPPSALTVIAESR